MGILISLKAALTALERNKMRTFLTMLGVIIGVAAVIAMVSVGSGASAQVEKSISSMGSNTIYIFPGTQSSSGARTAIGSGRTLTIEDSQAMTSECPSVAYATPQLRTGAQLVYGNQNWSTTIYGVNENFPYIRNWPVEEGVFFSARDVSAGVKLCVIGTIVRDNLFGSEPPIGKMLRIRNIPFKVVGVLREKGPSSFEEQDDTVIIPYTTAQSRLQNVRHMGSIMASAVSKEKVAAAVDEITAILRQRHHLLPGEENDFMVRTQAELAQVVGSTARIFTVLLASIASVSLLVGGIGIMNIMLVSVTERVREIGIRMAIGARERDIMYQFLYEALVLCLMGGLAGIMLGIMISSLITRFAGWPTSVSLNSIFLAFGFSAAVGIFFGLYPALKASRLDPIESLRHE
jgi:putative ABC transport system permease protein